MCNSATESPEWLSSRTLHCPTQKLRSKRIRVRIHRLNRRKRSEEKHEKDMELKNLKLYMENITILEENEKLRKKATFLNQENHALMYEFKKKLAEWDRPSTTLSQLPQKQ